jgi:hypothetical protein
MTTALKHLAVRLFNAFGLDIRRLRPATPPRDSMAGGLAQLARLGFQPRTVIDAGVAYATPAQRQLLDRQLDPLLAEAHEKHS